MRRRDAWRLRVGRALFWAASGVVPESVAWNDPRYWSTYGGIPNFIHSTNSGKLIDPDVADRFMAYFAAKRNLSEDIAKLPLITYRSLDDSDRTRAKDHPVYNLVRRRPNPMMSAITFWELLMHWALGRGNGRAVIQFDRGYPVTLWPVHPDKIGAEVVSQGEVIYRIKMGTGKADLVLPSGNVLDIHGPTKDGINGYSIAGLAAESIALGLSAEEFAARVFAQDATPSVALIKKGTIKDHAIIPAIKQAWKNEFAGVGNAFGVAVLDDETKVEKIGMNPEDAQMLATISAKKVDICGWFRMRPWQIGVESSDTNYSSLVEGRRDYKINTLHPWGERIAQECWFKLLDPEEQQTMFLEHLFDALLRGDPMERANVHRTYFNIGVETVNEIRRAENMNGAGPDADRRMVPLNIQTLERAVNAPLDPRNRQAFTGANNDPTAADHLPAIEAALSRVISKEAIALERRALKKDREHDAVWADEFFGKQHDFYLVSLEPAVAVLAGALGLTGTFEILDDAARARTQERKQEALTALATGNAARQAREWRDNGAAMEAEALMEAINA